MIAVHAIGFVRCSRTQVVDDNWGNVPSVIELVAELDPDSLLGIEEFSHVEVLYFFDRVPEGAIERTARHPRDNQAWPRVGVFAQRGKNRPNRLGSCIARITGRTGRALHVLGLDAIDQTPVLDLKPVMQEFLPREPVRQPSWATELMRDYW
jgi:tRNA-Thr(GGU) m(6)t(6)A37 methyltransferase TsaA